MLVVGGEAVTSDHKQKFVKMAVDPYHQDVPFDDDDLINDYTEEDDYGPPMDSGMDYDEAFLEEMMDAQQNGGENQQHPTTKAVEGTQSFHEKYKEDEAISHQKDHDGDLIMDKEIGHTRNSNTVPIEVTIDTGTSNDTSAETIVRKDKESQLYSFERYVYV